MMLSTMELIFLVSLLALLFAALAVCLKVMLKLKQQLSEVEEAWQTELNRLSDNASGSSNSLETQWLKPHIKLSIDDPLAVARQESKMAKLVEAVSPDFLKYKVYSQVAKGLKEELANKQIAVSVRISGLPGTD